MTPEGIGHTSERRSALYFGRKAYFLTIAKTQNITKAAQLLHVSQPSLSQYLNRQEEKLGVKLLDRSYLPIQLTEAGQIYLRYVEESMAVEQDFEKKLEQYKLRQSQTLSIGIPTQLMPIIFDNVVQNFITSHPDVRLTIKEGTSLTVTQQLIREEVDIAFFHTKERDDRRFVRHIYGEESLLLACNRRSKLARGRTAPREAPLTIKKTELDLLGSMRFLIASKEYYLCQLMREYIREIGIAPQEMLEISHLNSIIHYLLKPGSDGVSLLADFALRGTADTGQLSFFRVEGHDLSWYLTMNRLSGTSVSKIAAQFWEESTRLILYSHRG